MKEQFLRNIQILKAAITERKLVVFAGAGISADAGVPTWGELIAELKKDIDIPKDETDFLRIAQLYYNERQHKEFIDRIRAILKHKKLRYNEIHQEIFNLNPEHIITTNFNDLLEQVIKSKAYPFSVIKKDNEFPYARNTKLLVKMHGDLDEANLVIKEDDYLEYAANHPLIESFIKGVFATKVVLFIGYGFSDLNLKILLDGVRNVLGKDFQNAYLLSIDDEFHPSQRQYLRNKGVTVINYHDGGKVYKDDYINQYLFIGRNAMGHSVANRTEILSTKGAKLLYLLQFISKYNAFAESIHNDDALTQVHKSLDRFKNIRVLPPKFLSNLYPFNKWDGYIHNYNDYTLGSNNEKVIKFFFEEVDGKTLKLRDDFFKNNDVSIDRRDEMDKKLQSVLAKLNYSTIFHFGRTNSRIELFDHPKEFVEKISLTLPSKHCACLSCKFNEFDFKSFLKNIGDCTITETSELQNDMLIAYSNYKAGNFKTSINQFEEVGNKAWQVEEYIIYFIAQHNSKILTNLFKWDFEEASTESKKAILERIESLDLDKLMFQVPKLNDDVYKLLKTIRDDDVLSTSERNINEVYDKIVDAYEHFKRGGTISGPYYPEQIIEEFIKIFTFYAYNFIVKDEYTEYRNIYRKGIKALFISYATDKKYESRFTEFNTWVIRFILLYGDDDELKKILERYSITEMSVQQDELGTVVTYLGNLFSSVFDENAFLGRTIQVSKEIAKQGTNFFFQQRLRHIIHNALLVYSLIETGEEYGRFLVRKFLDFLSVENILIFASDNYFNKFLKRIISHFTFEETIELLSISLKKGFLIRSDEFFKIVSKAIKKNHSEMLVNDTDLIKTIITNSVNPKEHKHERGFMYLWEVSSTECKILIADNLRQDLSAHFYSHDYFVACAIGVVEPSEFYSNILSEIEGRVPKEFKLEGNWNFYSDLTLLNFIYMIYNKGLLREEIPYKKFEELPDYAQFYFRPYSFDYLNFNVDWLLPLKIKHIFEHLKSFTRNKDCFRKEFKSQVR